GASVGRRGAPIGTFRHLLLHVRSGGCFLSEIDVWAGEHKAPIDDMPPARQNLAVAAIGGRGAAQVRTARRRVLRVVPPHRAAVRLALRHVRGDERALVAFSKSLEHAPRPEELGTHTKGGPARWGAPIVTAGKRGADDGPYAVDTLTIPMQNKYGS